MVFPQASDEDVKREERGSEQQISYVLQARLHTDQLAALLFPTTSVKLEKAMEFVSVATL
jgi:hypothetical protein